MPAMPVTRGVGRTLMNETAIHVDSGSDRGRAHVHIVVHVMQALVRVLACAHAHAYASACCARPRGWRADDLWCSLGIIGRRGLCTFIRNGISQLVLTFTGEEGTSFASREVPTCAAILVCVVPASRGAGARGYGR